LVELQHHQHPQMNGSNAPLGLPPTAPTTQKKKKKRSSSSSSSRTGASNVSSKPEQKPSSKSAPRSKSTVNFQIPTAPAKKFKKSTSDYDQKFEEQQFILRVPTELAERIHNILKEAEQKEKSKKKDDKSEKRTDLDMDLIFGDHKEVLEFFKSGVMPKLPEEPIDINQMQNGTDKKAKRQKRREKDAKLDKLMDDSGYLTDVEYGVNEGRVGRFRLKDQIYPCELVDIPTLIEAYKSVDCMTYYKAGDISQMIHVKDKSELDKELNSMLNDRREHNKDEKARRKNRKKKRKKRRTLVLPKMYQLEHGITPSMRNVLQHWEKQRLNITKKDIEKMVDEFNKMMEDEDPDNIAIEVLEEDIKESSSEDESSSDEDEDEFDIDSDQEEDQLMAALEESSSNLLTPQRTHSTTTPSPMYSPSPAYTPSTPQLGVQTTSMTSDQSMSEMSSGGEEEEEDENQPGAGNTGFLTSQHTQMYRSGDETQSQSEEEDEEEDEEQELMAAMGVPQQGNQQNLRNERQQLENEIVSFNAQLQNLQSLITKAPNQMLKQRLVVQAQQAEMEIVARKRRLIEIDTILQQQAMELPPF
jgi:TATA-binding protein-associated factor Taf7